MTAINPEAPVPTSAVLCRGLRGLCPRCGKGRLFAGFLTVADHCDACGLSLIGHDSGDGPAVFVIFIAGFVVVGLAGLAEYMFAWPLWLHALVWGPLTLGLSIALLRPLKGLLIAAQHRWRAVDEPERPGGA